MSFTANDLAAIEAAIASGELKVAFKDREVVYRSMNDLIKARDLIMGTLAVPKKTRRQSYITRRMD